MQDDQGEVDVSRGMNCPATAGRRWTGLGVAVAVTLALAGCGSSSSSSSTSSTAAAAASTSAATTSTSAASAGVAHARQVVAQYSAPVTSYPVPTTPIKKVASLKGKTVVYIPLLKAIPGFAIVGDALKGSLASAGITERICDGGANPTTVAACLNQAVSEHAAGVITDAIPYEMAANAFSNAASHGIKVVIADQLKNPAHAQPGKVVYQPGAMDQAKLVADWLISDSNGHGNIIVAKETDSPTSVAMVQQYMVPEFKKYCPSCTVVYKAITASAPDQLASEVNSNIIKDPNVQYYYTEFEDSLQGTLQGVQQAGKINSLKVESASAGLGGLQKMAAGQAVYAEQSDDANYGAWADTDVMLRMLVGQPTIFEKIPERLFTRQNVKSLTLTPAAQATGEWYGNPNTFKTQFKKTWGLG